MQFMHIFFSYTEALKKKKINQNRLILTDARAHTHTNRTHAQARTYSHTNTTLAKLNFSPWADN